MFKIRAPKINDLRNLEQLFKDDLFIRNINRKKLFCLVQTLIPIHFRIIPSIHIATEEKNIVGFIVLENNSNTNSSWLIDEVFVLDEMRNKGIGEELLRYVLSVYGGYGVEHFLAEVDSQNFPALSLFHQCGFRRYSKVCFYKKEVELLKIKEEDLLDKDFILRPQLKNDLSELEKMDLSSIPPDLRPALGRSKNYYKNKPNTIVLLDKSRNLIVGWANNERQENSSYLIELLISPGWTHLYQYFLNTIIYSIETNLAKVEVIVKAIDYITDLTEMLSKNGYLTTEVKELLVRTIWQKAKEKKKKVAKVGAPSIAPT